MELKRKINIHFIFFFLFFTIFSSSFLVNSITRCSQEESHALILFKLNLSSINYLDDELINYYCQDDNYPVMMNWNPNSDCCGWNGVTCDHSTSDVIGLDLSCGMLQGTIHSNSSLFHLPHLRKLNLAFNYFYGSHVPGQIGMFSNTLTHLNLSECGFSGQIPSEISLLRKLVSLDLSRNLFDFKLECRVFINLLQNSTLLEELSVGGVDISSTLPTYLNFSSSLRLLNLRNTGLQGKLPRYIFNLRSLENLDLSGNSFTGHISSDITLLSKLVSLDLSLSGLEFQPHIFNNFLKNSTFLSDLILGYVRIGLVLPTYLNISSRLKSLYLGSTSLKGKLPNNIFNLQYLESLDLSRNTDLTGPLPEVNMSTSIPLKFLDLFSCSLVGSLPSWLFSLQSLKYLSLADNKLSGQIDVLDQEPVLQTFQKLTNLTYLDLSDNNFRGNWEFDTLLSSLKNLATLKLSYNGLSIMTNDAKLYVNPDFRDLQLASCKITVFPNSLRAMKNLQILDLSYNEIHGMIPKWAREIGGGNLYYLCLSNNKFQGLFPISICNMKNLIGLDISNNSFGGVIPKCIGNIISSLTIINLRDNHFQGTIPNAYDDCRFLEGFIMNGNQLEGEVPRFLSKCRYLKVVDLGNNHLNGTFPHWLEDLPNLHVLVLKSNNFHGPIAISSTELPFQSLQVLDLSDNGFMGQLPEKYFQNFKAMKNVVKNITELRYLRMGFMYYSITIIVKGVALEFSQILVHNTIIDVSCNKFQGDIPNNIGSLKSLKVLNLSHNNLNGQIPHSFGSLSEIESLDLSWNQLKGEIPKDLANIKHLAVLNLSQNHLVGRIPQGTQFNTFDASSFRGNSGLCGFPLPKCERSNSPQVEDDGYHDYDDESGCTWKVVLFGFGCGTFIGLVLGCLMLSTGKPKWFNEISDSVEYMILKRRYKRRYAYIKK